MLTVAMTQLSQSQKEPKSRLESTAECDGTGRSASGNMGRGSQRLRKLKKFQYVQRASAVDDPGQRTLPYNGDASYDLGISSERRLSECSGGRLTIEQKKKSWHGN